MADQPQLIYLEPDDEITSVVRRLRAAESGAVVIVAPGRSRATSSAVALRLLAQVAAEEARSISLVADAPTRAVAGEAGIAAFASVAEATSGAVPDHAAASPRAPIRVVRGASEVVAAPSGVHPIPAPRAGSGDVTMAVRLPPKPAPGGPGQRQGVRSFVPRWPWLAGLLIVAVIVAAALLPGATVSITPATTAVGPNTYQLHLAVAGHGSAELHATHTGSPTGSRMEEVAAAGTVTFFNRSTASVAIPQGTHVSVAGTTTFATTERIVVPGGAFFGDPGQKSVGVMAVVGGPTGNVAAGAIDTIDDANLRLNRRVTNDQPTTGGAETPHTVIQQSDVDAVVTAIDADLSTQAAAAVAGQPDRVYAGAAEVPEVNIPVDLVGTEDQASFELTGTLAFDRAYVMAADLDAAARAALDGDPGAAPQGTSILPDSIQVDAGIATVNGQEMTVSVSVRAAAAAAIDEAAVRDKVAGKSRAEAGAALADLGTVRIDLWPGWVDSLPRIPFRITVRTVAPTGGASPSP